MSETGLAPGSHLCIVLLTGLGDVIHGLPLANALKRADPSVRITWVVEPMPAPVVHEHPAVDDVVVFHKARGIAGVVDLARELRGRDPDLTLNLNIYFKSVFPTVLSRAPVRVGFDRGRARDLTWLFANRRLPQRPRAHTQDMFLEFLDLLGIEAEPLEWRLEPTAEERERQAEFFHRFDRPVAAVVPATANPAKDWLPDRWAAVIDGLERDFAILSAAESRPVVAMGDGIRPLLWRLHGSALVVAPDTGPVHMARAMDVPVVGLYGHTNPWRVGPYRRYQDLWVDAYTDPGDAPDPSNFTPKHGRMERITAADVLDRVAAAVERYPESASGTPAPEAGLPGEGPGAPASEGAEPPAKGECD
jgi:heptosyltransferase I